MRKHHLYTLAIILTLIGVALFSYKVYFLQFPLQPLTVEDTWDVETRVSFSIQNLPAKVSLYIPRSGGIYSAIDERFISRGYKVKIHEADGNRQATWIPRKASDIQFLYFRTTIRQAVKIKSTPKKKIPKTEIPNFEGAKLVAAKILLADIQTHSFNNDTLIKELIYRFAKKPADDYVSFLARKKVAAKDRLILITRLLAVINLPARVANGFLLENFTREAKLRYWLEVYHEGRWHKYDPKSGEPYAEGKILSWWHGKEKLVQVTGDNVVTSKVSISLDKEPALMGAMWREQQISPALSRYSLLGLPIETQSVYQTLLTVPVGVFLLLIFKNIIGIKTFGTFTPVLIALAFREAPLFWGILLFSLVVGLGLIVRLYLEELKLSRVPRLTAVLIVVVILTGIVSMISYRLGVYQGLSITLLPMVILAMTIEKISVAWEKHGPKEALQRGLGSLLVATAVYVVMDLNLVKHQVLIFPELLLVLLAVTLILGRYSGSDLIDRFKFKIPARPEKSGS